MFLAFFVFLATQMQQSMLFLPLSHLVQLMDRLFIAMGVLAVFCTSMRLSWRIRYENFQRMLARSRPL